ncbi:MAG: ABC transporter substrate-binding protein [Propionibacteriaceae bacterium]|jgi:peptide/nickel transport system substrate-binding protein|nr:ABC transporter substrate-binding protein [Propionibacteriaceae bacterium]
MHAQPPSRSALHRFLAVPAAAVIVAAGLLAGCSPDTDPGPGGTDPTSEPLTLVIGSGATSGPNWDPASKIPDSFLTYAIYDPLLYIDFLTQEATPWVAESYEWDEARTTLTLHLREGVRFTDGAPYDAQAVVTNIEYVRHNPAADRYSDLVDVTNVAAVDAQTVQITMTSPDPQFIAYLGMYRIASPAALQDPDTLSQNPVGSGPYILDMAQTVADSEYVFVRNPDYWNPGAFPYDIAKVLLIPDNTARINALKSGQVDYIAGVTAATAADVQASGFGVYNQRSLWFGLAMDDVDGDLGSPIADRRVRQAIAYAIDRETIFDTIDHGLSAGGNQIWTDGQPFYRPDRANEYAYDPNKARALMAEAGYADGFELTIPTFAGWMSEPYQPIIGQYLSDIGITINWQMGTYPDLVVAWESDTYPVFTIVESFPTTTAQVLYPRGIHNVERWTSPEINSLLDSYSSGADAAAAQAAAEIGDIVMDEVWFIVISQPYQSFGYDLNKVQVVGDPMYVRAVAPAN